MKKRITLIIISAAIACSIFALAACSRTENTASPVFNDIEEETETVQKQETITNALEKTCLKLGIEISVEPYADNLINQYQYQMGMPSGCEVVSLDTVLRAMGFDIDAFDLNDLYMPMDDIDYIDSYVGSPYADGGSLPPSICTCYRNLAIDLSFGQADYEHPTPLPGAYDISGCDFNDILSLLEGGYPVMLWLTDDYSEPRFNLYDDYSENEDSDTADGQDGSEIEVDSISNLENDETWMTQEELQLAKDMEENPWWYNEHCLVAQKVVSSDEGNSYIVLVDSINGESIYLVETICSLWEQCGKYAMCVL